VLGLSQPVEPCLENFAMSPQVQLFRVALVAMAVPMATSMASAQVTAEKSSDKVTIKIDGRLFAEYLTNSNGKPIVWPIIGPSGGEMTRSYPMKKSPGEETDHPHQRSLWFTHGDVNGVDFWLEGERGGKQRHKEFVTVESGKQAAIVTRNDWVAPDGKKILEDERRLSFSVAGENRVIDFAITLTATEGPVTFGDTKEGSFGLRVAETMRVQRRRQPAAGRILNSEGQTNTDAWGKRAGWVDYSGPVVNAAGTEEVAGIAILNHPDSFRFPTYWHVRDYGLFAANPFGVHDFESGKERGAGNHTVNQGESLLFMYRVIFHKGAGEPDQIKRAFSEYSAPKQRAVR
jgi:hypothetical protein